MRIKQLRNWLAATIPVIAMLGCNVEKPKGPYVSDVGAFLQSNLYDQLERVVDENGNVRGVSVGFSVHNWSQEGMPSDFNLIDDGYSNRLSRVSFYDSKGKWNLIDPTDKAFKNFVPAYDWAKTSFGKHLGESQEVADCLLTANYNFKIAETTGRVLRFPDYYKLDPSRTKQFKEANRVAFSNNTYFSHMARDLRKKQ